MAWIEFIRLSTTSERARELTPVLADMAGGLRQSPGLMTGAVLRHSQYEGDVALVLIHRGADRSCQTKEALAAADYLRSYGMVDHQVWSLVHPDDWPIASPPRLTPAEPAATAGC